MITFAQILSSIFLQSYTGYSLQSQTSPVHDVIANTSRTGKASPRTLISYAYFVSPHDVLATIEPEHKDTSICSNNLEVFLQRGYSEKFDADFIFHVIGDTPVPDSLHAISTHSNVEIHKETNCGADLCAHKNFLDTLTEKRTALYSEFIFLNCGTRGPYTHANYSEPAKNKWYAAFRDELKNDTLLTGPTISCEQERHVQTYAIGASLRALPIIQRRWRAKADNEKWDSYIHEAEVGLSHEVLDMGANIVAFGVDACQYGDGNPFVCKPCQPAECSNPRMSEKMKTECSKCFPLDVKRVMFIKNGGTVAKYQLLNPYVEQSAAILDMHDLSFAISSIHPPDGEDYDALPCES